MDSATQNVLLCGLHKLKDNKDDIRERSRQRFVLMYNLVPVMVQHIP